LPTREQTLSVFGRTGDYIRVAEELHIPAGQAYLVATGLPADGGDTFSPDELARPGVLAGSTQHLVYHSQTVENPTAKQEVHEWIKGRAAKDAPMTAAARKRDAAPAEVVEPEETDITTVLTRQHDQVTAMLKELKTVPGVTKGGSEVQQSRRASIVDMITVALSKHEATEEELFWPWVREVLDDGDELAATALQQEQEGKNVLAALSKTQPSDETFDELAEELDSRARKHVAFEDRVLLALSDSVGRKERQERGAQFLSSQGHAPTRPHPHAPKSPAAAVKAAGAAGAAVDKVRDSVGDRPAKRRGRAENEPPEQATEGTGTQKESS
jgi:hemerythrin-like domain-containing protein